MTALANAMYTRCFGYGLLATDKRVDMEKRVIYGVAIATKGPALGHGVHIDDESLRQIVQLASQGSDNGPIRVRMDHPEGEKGIDNPIGKTLGSAKNFRLDGDVVRADIHLFSATAAPHGAQLLALATEAPEHLGASLVFKEKKQAGTNPAVRFSQIFAVDFVDFPAASPNGLFSAGTNTKGKPMALKAFVRNGILCCMVGESEHEIEVPTEFAAKAAPKTVAADDTTKFANGVDPAVHAQALAKATTDAIAAEREYSKNFNTAVTAAGLTGKAAEDFAKFYGRPIEDVKFLASNAIGQRTTAVGEGGTSDDAKTPEQKAADAETKFKADLTTRWHADGQLRRLHGVNSADKNDTFYLARMDRYVRAEIKCRDDETKGKGSAVINEGGSENDSITRLMKNRTVLIKS